MPIKKLPQLTAWSYSRLAKFRVCPMACRLANIDRIREPEGEALVRGQRVEADALAYLENKKLALPASCARFPEEFAELRKIGRRVMRKLKLAFDKDWKLLDDYFHPATWFRMEFDLVWEELLPGSKKHWRVHVVDLKTGRIYEDKLDQVELYNFVALILPDDIITHGPQTAFSEMWYLDQGDTRNRTLLITNLEKERKRWEAEAAKLLNETAWQPKPGEQCRRCFYRQSNKAAGGGQCPY